MKKVLVLLSSYNGEKFIVQQLDSILNQHNVQVSILIRDDGSRDKTLDILKSYKGHYPDKINILPGRNVGCRESFLQLISSAANDASYDSFEYFAFADQDDVWMDDKLSTAVQFLDKAATPIKLYYCVPRLVDINLTPLPSNIKKANDTVGASFLLSPAIGCSMVFSKDLLFHLANPMANTIPAMHDSLTYKLTLALGGKVIQDLHPHILYRQHSNNTIGGAQSFKQKWKRRISTFVEGKKEKSKTAKAILDIYKDHITLENQKKLSLLANYDESIVRKSQLIFSREYLTIKPLHNILFRIAAIFNKL